MTLIRNLPVDVRSDVVRGWVGTHVTITADTGLAKPDEVATLSGLVVTVCHIWMSAMADVLILQRPGMSTIAVSLSKIRTIHLGQT